MKKKYTILLLIISILCNIMCYNPQPIIFTNADTFNVSSLPSIADISPINYPQNHIHYSGSSNVTYGEQDSSGGCYTSAYTWHPHGDHDHHGSWSHSAGWCGNNDSCGNPHVDCDEPGCDAWDTHWSACSHGWLKRQDAVPLQLDPITHNPMPGTGLPEVWEYWHGNHTHTHEWGSSTHYTPGCSKGLSTCIAKPNVCLQNGKVHCSLNPQISGIYNISWNVTKYNTNSVNVGSDSGSGNTVDFVINAPIYKVTVSFRESEGASHTVTEIPAFLTQLTITYNSNNGSGGSTAQNSILYTDWVANLGYMQQNGFVRDGYDFTGWSKTAVQIDSTPLVAKNLLSNTINVKPFTDGDFRDFTAYATWKHHNYTIVFHPANPNDVTNDLKSDGTVIDVNTYTYQQSGFKYHDANDTTSKQAFIANKYTKTGYQFAGWGFTPQTQTVQSDGRHLSDTKVAYNNLYAGDNIRIPTNGTNTRSPNNDEVIHLYAQWIPNTYYLVIHSNDILTDDEPTGDKAGNNKTLTCTYDRYLTDLYTNLMAINQTNEIIITGLNSRADWLQPDTTLEKQLRLGDNGTFVELELSDDEQDYADHDWVNHLYKNMTVVQNQTLHIYVIRDIYHILYQSDSQKPTKVYLVDNSSGTSTKLRAVFYCNDGNLNEMFNRNRDYLMFGH